MKIGVVALSFGATFPLGANFTLYGCLRLVVNKITGKQPAASNNAHRSASRKEVIVVAQHEIAEFLTRNVHGEFDVHVVDNSYATHYRNGRPYLDTQDVMNEAFRVFKEEGVDEIVVIAHPFLHRWLSQRLAKKAGFTVTTYRYGGVDFDSDAENQWWCRGPVRFLAYLGIQAFGKVIGKDFHGIGDKPRGASA